MVITNNGKPIALLTPLSDKTLEDTLSAVRRARAINAVKLIQQQSIKNGLDKITLEEINDITLNSLRHKELGRCPLLRPRFLKNSAKKHLTLPKKDLYSRAHRQRKEVKVLR
jgi:antitoxin (DNA-binding transcriptional repressor) of toxin-antitoxin stability system